MEFTTLCKLASSVATKKNTLLTMFPLLYAAVDARQEGARVTCPPSTTLSDLGALLLTLTDDTLATTLKFLAELLPALASWGFPFKELGTNLDHELAMRVRLGHLGPIVLDPIETCFNIMPVAAFAIHAVLALCTARSSPALRDLYTYIDRLKLFSGSTHQVFQAFNAFNLKMSAVARAGSRVNHTRIVLGWCKALSALLKADPVVPLERMNDCLLPVGTLARLEITCHGARDETELSFLSFAKKFVLACSSLDPEAPTDPSRTAALVECLYHFRSANTDLARATGGDGATGHLFSLDGGRCDGGGRCSCGRYVPATSGFCLCGQLTADAWLCTCPSPRIYHPSVPACNSCKSPPTGRAPTAEQLAANIARVRALMN